MIPAGPQLPPTHGSGKSSHVSQCVQPAATVDASAPAASRRVSRAIPVSFPSMTRVVVVSSGAPGLKALRGPQGRSRNAADTRRTTLPIHRAAAPARQHLGVSLIGRLAVSRSAETARISPGSRQLPGSSGPLRPAVPALYQKIYRPWRRATLRTMRFVIWTDQPATEAVGAHFPGTGAAATTLLEYCGASRLCPRTSGQFTTRPPKWNPGT
jgi:hypothetical protein